MLEKRRDALTASHSAELNALNETKAQLSDAERDLAGLGRRIETENGLVSEYTGRREKLEGILHDQTETMRSNTTEIAAQEATVATLKAEKAEFEAEAGVREAKERARIDALLEGERLELKKVQKTRADEEAELTRIRGDYNQTARDYRALVDKETATKDRIASLETELGAVRDQVNSTRAEKVQAEERVAALQTERESLNNELAALQGQIQAKNDELVALRDEKKRLESEVAALSAQYEVEKTKLFIIAERERKVAAKEDFIKEKYKQAGIEYGR